MPIYLLSPMHLTPWTVRFGEDGYPSLLLPCSEAPRILHGLGTFPCGHRAVAIVGSRAASRVARERTREIATTLAQAGYVIVSGGALGVDAAAHRAALDAKGLTVAVLGTSIDERYPARNRALLDEIAVRGALLSPFDKGQPIRRGNFPRRNYVIAGLADAAIIVEASSRSGSLWTAAAARRYGRRVLAVPGSPGTQRLIAEGAFSVGSSEDVLAVLNGRQTLPKVEPARSDTEIRLLAALSARPRTIDEVARAAQMPAARVSSLLLVLELRGAATRRDGGYVRTIGN